MLLPFFRVAHIESGKGPYTHEAGNLYLDSPLRAHDGSRNHPITGWRGTHVRNGFRSLAQFKAWFSPEERRWLRANGFVLWIGGAQVYDYDDGYQVVAAEWNLEMTRWRNL